MADSRTSPEETVAQLKSVIGQIESIRPTARNSPARSHEVEALALGAIRRLAPAGTTHRTMAERIASSSKSNPAQASFRSAQVTDPLLGVLNALLYDYKHGFLNSVEEGLRAGVFGDFLSIAEYLVTEDRVRYKDPAAVITGVVLEEHLRKLALKHSIPEDDPPGKRKKADTLNADLYKAEAYTLAYQKNITGWLQIRNDAVHANWVAYNGELVVLMLQGTKEFIAHYPA